MAKPVESESIAAGSYSERRLITQNSWYVISNSHLGVADPSSKVLPTLNYLNRIKDLNQISKNNIWLYSKLQNVRSTINTKSMLD